MGVSEPPPHPSLVLKELNLKTLSLIVISDSLSEWPKASNIELQIWHPQGPQIFAGDLAGHGFYCVVYFGQCLHYPVCRA